MTEGLIKGHETWLETCTGRHVDPIHMGVEEIFIEDIAGPLSRLCRFVGQCKKFYAVGQHSIHVAEVVADRIFEDGSPTLRQAHATCRAALLHDAAEAYTNDISRPVKYALKAFKEMEDILLHKVMQRFDCVNVDWELIHKADNALLATEAYYLMPSKGENWDLPEKPLLDFVIPVMWMGEVESKFMQLFHKYGGK